MQEYSFEEKLKFFFTKTSPLCYCLVLFFLFKVVFMIEASWTAGGVSPELWFWRWDSYWYADIINHGYSTLPGNTTQELNIVFFPLLPMIVGGLYKVTHIPLMWLGPIFCQLCFLISLLLFYQILKIRFQTERAARLGVLFLAFSPANIYFSAFYTESLFLLLSLIIWFGALKQRWWLVTLAGILITVTHANGLMIIAPLCYFAYQAYRQHKLTWSAASMLLIPLGLLIYMGYLHYHCGDAMAFIQNEKMAWSHPGLLSGHIVGLSPRVVIVLIITIYLCYRLLKSEYKAEAIYFIAMLLPALLSGSLFSFFRFSMGLFSFYFGLTLLSYQKQYLPVFLFASLIIFSGAFVFIWVAGLGLA